MLAAQFKAGKTTLVGNLIRSLIDGDAWLGRDVVAPIAGTVALLDFEMSAVQLDDRLRAQHIRGDDRVTVVPLRGHAAGFNIIEADCLARNGPNGYGNGGARTWCSIACGRFSMRSASMNTATPAVFWWPLMRCFGKPALPRRSSSTTWGTWANGPAVIHGYGD